MLSVFFVATRLNCDNCEKNRVPAYHLAMSDTSIRNFCTLACVMAFQVMTFSYSRILLYTASKGQLFPRRHHFPIIGSTVTLKIYSCNLTSVEPQLDLEQSAWIELGKAKNTRYFGYLVLDLALLTND